MNIPDPQAACRLVLEQSGSNLYGSSVSSHSELRPDCDVHVGHCISQGQMPILAATPEEGKLNYLPQPTALGELRRINRVHVQGSDLTEYQELCLPRVAVHRLPGDDAT